MPVSEHSRSCPYCNELITVFIELPENDELDDQLDELSLDQQQDCQVCCRPIYIRLTSDPLGDGSIGVELISENDVY